MTEQSSESGKPSDAVTPSSGQLGQGSSRLFSAVEGLLKRALEANRLAQSEIRELERKVEKAELRVQEIEQSGSWRVTAPLRRIVDGVRIRKAENESKRKRFSCPLPGEPARRYPSFDRGLEKKTQTRLREYLNTHPGLSNKKVSVVLPTFQRASILGRAVDSVCQQSHTNWELLIVDDGSTDNTIQTVAAFADSRIRYIPQPHLGVGKARNLGLQSASGEYVAFLDSDNEWNPDFLSLMLAFIEAEGLDAAYSGMEIIEDGRTHSYRGAEFDFEACLAGNYIDLNVLVHKNPLSDPPPLFDPQIRRTNDWDYILRIGRNRSIGYAPFVGAKYYSGSPDRITSRAPQTYGKLVQERFLELKNKLPDSEEPRVPDLLEAISFEIAIAIAAPRDERETWGDFHFALGLSQAFERRGHSSKIVFRGEPIPWDQDVVIVLRGLEEVQPQTGAVNVLWSISHPDLLDPSELEGFDIRFYASDSLAAALEWSISGEHHVLLQATDRSRFFPRTQRDARFADTALFVGNSRLSYRELVTRAALGGIPLSVFGKDWNGLIPEQTIQGDYLDNNELGIAYASAPAVLNDHWDSMRDFGYVSNRIFDILGSGGVPVSDYLPDISRIFGTAVTTVRPDEDIEPAILPLLETPTSARDRDRDIALWILEHHSFDSRAETIIAHVERHLLDPDISSSRQPTSCPICQDSAAIESRPNSLGEPPESPPTIGVFIHEGTPNHRAFSRIIQPLTSDLENGIPDLVRLNPDDPDEVTLRTCDMAIIPDTVLRSLDHSTRIVALAESSGTRIVLDCSETITDGIKEEAVIHLARHAAEVWCSDIKLMSRYEDISRDRTVTIPDSLDRRLWTPYRKTRADHRDQALKILVLPPFTHSPDSEALINTFEEVSRLSPMHCLVLDPQFDLPSASWIGEEQGTLSLDYQRFTRRIRTLAQHRHVGIITGPPPIDGLEMHAARFLALGLIPVLSFGGASEVVEMIPDDLVCPDRDSLVQKLVSLSDPTTRDTVWERLFPKIDHFWKSQSASVIGDIQMQQLRSLIGE